MKASTSLRSFRRLQVMVRRGAIGGTGVVLAVATLGTGWTTNAAGATGSVETEARGVVVEFFRSQNERRYDDTCGLLSRGFYKSHGLRDQQTCVAVLRVAYTWSGRIEFRIGKVTRQAERVVVRAVADGSPGRIVLLRENGTLKIFAVQEVAPRDGACTCRKGGGS